MEKFRDRIFTEEVLLQTFLEELKEKLKSLGIKAILFDLDDTLIYTSEIFVKYKQEYVARVAEETEIECKVIEESLNRIDAEEYKKMGVNPARWEESTKKIALEFAGYEKPILENLNILMKIYSEEPRLRPGVKAVLEILRMAGIKIALVTHANEDWTWRKLKSTGLIDYFDTINIVNENRHKGAEDWAKTAGDVEVLPAECLILGDSLVGDVIPGASIGARTMWLHRGSTWSVYRAGEVPENTVHLDEVNELLSALEGLR